jgi:hypothetical protein
VFSPGPNVGEGLLSFATSVLLVAAKYRGLIVRFRRHDKQNSVQKDERPPRRPRSGHFSFIPDGSAF